jgi:hypothetical protein
MNKSVLRGVILVTGLITAGVHLFMNVVMGHFDLLFTLNGLGYLGLLAAFFFNLPWISRQRTLLHYLFMLYAATTIVAWFIMGSMTDPIGISTKIDEAILIVALFLHLRAEKAQA